MRISGVSDINSSPVQSDLTSTSNHCSNATERKLDSARGGGVAPGGVPMTIGAGPVHGGALPLLGGIGDPRAALRPWPRSAAPVLGRNEPTGCQFRHKRNRTAFGTAFAAFGTVTHYECKCQGFGTNIPGSRMARGWKARPALAGQTVPSASAEGRPAHHLFFSLAAGFSRLSSANTTYRERPRSRLKPARAEGKEDGG